MYAEVKRQLESFLDGFIDVISRKELESKLEESLRRKRPLRIKYGADPSAPDLHLGHTVPLRKLRALKDLGHKVIFIIGDFTARIGDPSERSETRPMLSEKEIKKNSKTYQEQVFKILDPKKTEVQHNSKWLKKMKPENFLKLMSEYTVARLLERDDFSKRYKSGEPIAVVEFLYPLLQGFDSVQIKADIEIGGTDQLFNLLVGRELQRSAGEAPQVVLTLPLIEGTDGIQKMSKSLGNHIALNDSPREMFGKIMSLPDELMEKYYRYASALKKDEVSDIMKKLKEGNLHPRTAKVNLAKRIVSLFYSSEIAESASREFDEIFQKKGLPDDVLVVKINEKEIDICSLLFVSGLVPSKSEARRFCMQGAVKFDNEKILDAKTKITLSESAILQCGKRKFARIEYDPAHKNL